MSAAAARLTFDAAARVMNGAIVQAGTRGTSFAGAASDGREVEAGQLFFALPGERVDGFDFAAQAAAAGAAGIVVARGRGTPAGCQEVAIIEVDDPRRALGDLARAVRAKFKGRVVGVTGSNGKTTTKELVAAALGPLGSAMRTPGNRNTDVGLPLTVLGASGTEASWVLEMAMRAPGEIAYLAEIARPDVAVITNVAAAHLETLGSVEKVAKAKGEIYGGLSADGYAVLPADDPLIAAEAARIPAARRITFDGRRGGDVRVLDYVPAGANGAVVRYAVRDTPVVVRLPLGGSHNAKNGAAALAVALAAGVAAPAAAAQLEKVALPPHRSATLSAGGRTIFDDCYNANPASMSAALAAVAGAAAGGRVFGVLGDMLELGPQAEALHRKLGGEAAGSMAGLVAVGSFAAAMVDGARAAGLSKERSVVAKSPEEAAAVVAPWTAPGDWIVVKGSRGVRLERAVDQLREALGPTAKRS